MNSQDLFSFLDDVPMEDNNDEPGAEQMDADEPRIPKKRKANDAAASNIEVAESEPGPSAQKKLRIASPKPVVVDEFETEAKREVAASAGLTGGVEAGSRLELRHQVRLFI